MPRTAVECEDAIAICVAKLAEWKRNLPQIQSTVIGQKRDTLVQLARDSVQMLEIELQSLRQEVDEARKREAAGQ